MRVSLILDLVNKLAAGRKAAERDLNAVRKAAEGVGGGKTAPLVERLDQVSPAAKKAARELRNTGRAARELAGARGAEKVARDVERVAPASRRAAHELRGTGSAARQLGAVPGARRMVRDFDGATAAARKLRREIDAVAAARRKLNETSAAGPPERRRPGKKPESPAGKGGGGTGVGLGAAALAAGRDAIMPLAAAYGGYRGVTAGIRGTVGQSISFEKAMAEVRKKVDGMDDAAELAKLERSIARWAIAYGRPREDVAALVAEAGAGGVSLPDMPDFVRINLAASTAWDASASQAGNALAKIRAATQWSNADLEVFVDKVNALADAGSSKEMDVVDMFQRAGAAAKAAGVEFDTSLAFLAAMNNVAIAPEVAARGFAAFAARLRTAGSQGKGVGEGLEQLGLSTKKVEAGMKTDATRAMIDVLERLDKHADKAAIAIKVFGREWWDEIARAGQALPEIRKSLAIVNDPKAWKGSAQNNLNIQLQTTDNHLTRLKALTNDVGDRLGRWALPAINEGVERIIAGMDALEKRAEAAKERERLATKVASETPLSPEERERLANDRVLAANVARRANQISAQQDWRDTANRNQDTSPEVALRERAALLRRQHERQIATLEAELKLTPDGFGDRRKRQQLTALRRKLADLPLDAGSAASPARIDPRRPADQSERRQLAGVPDRAAAEALRVRIAAIQQRLAILDDLTATARTSADRRGFQQDAAPHRRREAEAQAQLIRAVAPQLMASMRFGLTGPGVLSQGQESPPVSPGRLSFGLQGAVAAGEKATAAWAQKVRDDFEIDLGPAGMTMAERFAAGLRTGTAGASAAAGEVAENVRGALEGVDLGTAAAAAMNTYAAGITANGAKAVAAAKSVADQVKATLTVQASASVSPSAPSRPRALSGALHDGVE